MHVIPLGQVTNTALFKALDKPDAERDMASKITQVLFGAADHVRLEDIENVAMAEYQE